MTDLRMNRRGFLKGALAAGGTVLAAASPVKAGPAKGPVEQVAKMIDLTKCDGCPARGTPACVDACRLENARRFPEPEKPIADYWPQKKHEDWSEKRHLTGTLTPYNWTFVQKATVEHEGRTERVSIPRQCMHCDNPPCANLCPVGANTKTPEGPVVIDDRLCLGGAKCRAACPWKIPQRQAGVGIYLNFDPAAGGGVMYKCDLCRDRVKDGREPACVEACRSTRGGDPALHFGPKSEIVARATERAAEIGGHLYGLEENGGTSTIYVSAVPFEKINEALVTQQKDLPKMRRFHMAKVKNPMEKDEVKLKAAMIAPVAGIVSGIAAAGRTFVKTASAADRKEDDNAA